MGKYGPETYGDSTSSENVSDNQVEVVTLSGWIAADKEWADFSFTANSGVQVNVNDVPNGN
jgi:hypothetical protein